MTWIIPDGQAFLAPSNQSMSWINDPAWINLISLEVRFEIVFTHVYDRKLV